LDKHPKLWNMDMRFGTWNVRRWEGGGTEPVGEYTFFYGKGNENHELGTGFLCIRESYHQIRGLSLCVIGCHT
jgi:hypothetical protein